LTLFFRCTYNPPVRVDEDKLYRTVGERLRRIRLGLEVTQAGLAEAAGVMRTSVVNLEAGRQRPPLHVLYRLCGALGVEVNDVLPSGEEVAAEGEALVEVEGVEGPLTPRLAEFLKSVGTE
jgi:transcriptional regulator with XRE-family HTH domain